MKKIIALALMMFTSLGQAALPDLTGNYTGCGDITSLGKHQVVFILVKMPTGFGPDDFKYSGGIYWKSKRSNLGSDFFSDVRMEESTGRILMRAEIIPRNDFGVIVKSVDARINPDGSITGTLQTNATGADGRFQSATWTVKRVTGIIEPMNCQQNADLQ